MNERYRTVALAAALVLPAAAASANDEERTPAWQVSGDFRTMYNPAWRDTRSGGESESDPIGARFRLRLKRELNEHWTFQTRFATTWEDEGNDPEFYLRSERESGTEVEPGTATLDELFVEYRGDAGTRLRIGRQQSTMTLPLLTSKSLDRNQASNINIGWTDGISVRQPI
ncbi:MAG: hypothetical protein R3323_05780, partial [Wenzhouxiangellaceae bacterium]|nr:hypothetical protein [Wenzhouxiangellaceae bacterium]